MARTGSVVVTGVSTGIGAAIARAVAARGHHVFGSVRRPEAAEALSAELGPRFTPLVFDVRDEAAIQAAAGTVAEALPSGRLLGLVNNAGIAVAGPLSHLPLAAFRDQIEVNVTGPLAVTQAFLPLLGTDRARPGKPGRIVNISSVSGRLASPFVGAYSASKFALEGLSESLRRELMLFGIDVVVVAPGAVATPIWDKAEAEDVSPYASTPYAAALDRLRAYALSTGRKGLAPERIAEAVMTGLFAPRPPARITVVKGRLMNWSLPISLPTRILDRILARQLGFPRRED